MLLGVFEVTLIMWLALASEMWAQEPSRYFKSQCIVIKSAQLSVSLPQWLLLVEVVAHKSHITLSKTPTENKATFPVALADNYQGQFFLN